MRKLNVLGIISTIVAYTILSGCSNSTDAIIEEAKDNKYAEIDDYYFEQYVEELDGSYAILGHSMEEDVIVCYERFDEPYSSLLKIIDAHALFIQKGMWEHGYDDVTVYVEFCRANGERFALLTVTSDDYKIEEVK